MSKIKYKSPQKERFRDPFPVLLYDFGDDIDLDQFEFFGYLMGERVDQCKTLTIYHFDSIKFIQTSTNPKAGGEFIHAIGHRIKENSYQVIILKKRENEIN